MTTEHRDGSPAIEVACADDDYRESHATRGGTYDQTLAGSAFDAYMTKWETHWLTDCVRALHPGGIGRYLDFACGTGRITQTVAPLVRESIGVDVSASMLDVARKRCPAVNFVQRDLTREPHALGSFDLVTAFRFFGNAQDQLRRGALAAIVRLLRPGGHLIVNNHRNPQSLSALLHRASGGACEMDLTLFKLRRLLRECGLAPARTIPIGFWLFRAGMQLRSGILESGEVMERRFGSAMYAPFAPDMIVVARKA